jgi:ferredoxin
MLHPDYDGAIPDLEASLRELQTERIDLWQLHNVMDRGLWKLDIYRSLDVSPEACTECESCVEVCPAGIRIPQRLREAVELLG